MRPGVTIRPPTSRLLVSEPALRPGPSAATLPAAKATSSRSSIDCEGSITRPPRRIRSYAMLCQVLDRHFLGQKLAHREDAHQGRHHEDGMADDHGDKRSRNVRFAKEDEKRETGDDRRHEEGEEDHELHRFAGERSAAAIVNGKENAKHHR